MIRPSALLVLLLVSLSLLAAVACGGDDDNASETTAATSLTEQTAKPSAADATTAAAAATTQAAAATTAASSAGGGSSHNGEPFEVCDVFTGEVVAEALGDDNVTDFENASFGRQAFDDPFTFAEQCQFTDYNTTGDTAWLLASFAPDASAADVLAHGQEECSGQDPVDGIGDFACYPQYTGQLRVVSGSAYLIFFVAKTSGGGDQKAMLKALADKTLPGL